MEHFGAVKARFKRAISDILSVRNSYELDEAALPAYAHKNPLIDRIFWKRVRIAYDYATKLPQGSRILDFGCGTGLLSYAIAQHGYSVISNDIEFGPLKLVQEKIKFPANITFLEGDLIKQSIQPSSVDLIIALDVLEHIPNLDDYIYLYKRILKPGGVVLVSGPTENVLYKIGRKIAGSRFSGEYHVSNIARIKSQFENKMPTRTLAKIMWPMTLFEIFVSENR